MTDWHEDSAARSKRLRGEKTVEQRLADIEARLDAMESRPVSVKFSNLPRVMYGNVHEPLDHDPLGR
jgi:predicted Zn-dependent peptidase